jgi:hypothetical protein
MPLFPQDIYRAIAPGAVDLPLVGSEVCRKLLYRPRFSKANLR